MFLLFLIAMLVAEIIAFIEVGHAIGWLLAIVALIGISVLGTQVVRIQGRSAIERVSLAVSEHRPPARAAIDGLLGFLDDYAKVTKQSTDGLSGRTRLAIEFVVAVDGAEAVDGAAEDGATQSLPEAARVSE